MINTNLGPYRILAKVGEGGMGEVYAARDTKLNRDVALKLLPAAVAHDRDRLSRFRREAQLLAALNHPHIAQIYGIEDSTERPALVMEFVSGRTLADLIASGPVPLDEAIGIARQIAEALEAAHERGIVHRDLKPSNVCVTEDGTVKVLDFGLAKALDPSSGIVQPEGGDNSPTFTSPVMLPQVTAGSTAAGMILGTAGYMAPEQAKGRPIDKRADIWAFGVVLAEMLIGRPLFGGDSVAETIASVIKDDPRPKLDGLPPATPAAVRRLLARCLERDPKLRLRDIGEARILLSRPLEAEPVAPPPGRQRNTWIGAAAAALAIAAAAAAAAWFLAPAPRIPVRRFELPASVSAETDFAIAPDGGRLAYIDNGHLFVRAFDQLDPQDLGAVHVTAAQPVWSPDGSTIAFTAEGTIRSIPATGGPQFVIARVPASGVVLGMGWLHDGRIVFSVWRDSLYTVSASGGTPAVRLAVDEAREVDFHHVAVLPDDRLLVSTHLRQGDSDVVELVDGDRRTVLTEDPDVLRFTYVEPGVLVFQRRTMNPGVWAIPFRSGPIDVNRAVLVEAGAAAYDVSRDGTLVAFMPAPSRRGLVWIDRSAAATPAPGPLVEATTNDLELSPDGTRVAFVQGRLTSAGSGIGSVNNATIVVRDLKSGVDTRLTLDTAAQGTWADAGGPTWNPAGDRVIHREGSIEQQRLVERRADAASEGRTLAAGSNGRLLPDGKTLIYTVDERGAERLRSATITADGPTNTQSLFPDTSDPDVVDFDLSPDGRLIAFVVQQPSRRGDVYVASLKDLPVRHLVSEGAVRPRFAREGRELFFLSGTQDDRGQPRGRLMSVTVTSGPGIAVGAPVEILRETPGGPDLTSYDVAPDGSRFLMWMTAPVAPEDRSRLIFVQNALAALR